MSDKKKHPAAEVWRLFVQLDALLRPFCERLTFAGSLRRERPTCGDLEILMVPKIIQEQNPESLLPDMREVNLADRMIDSLVASGLLGKRLNVRGSATWGPQNKLAIHLPTKIPVDIFSTTEKRWAVSLVIRTGPAEFNIRLIQTAARNGIKVHAYGVFESMKDGGKIIPQSEREILELAGLPWTEPKDRKL